MNIRPAYLLVAIGLGACAGQPKSLVSGNDVLTEKPTVETVAACYDKHKDWQKILAGKLTAALLKVSEEKTKATFVSDPMDRLRAFLEADNLEMGLIIVKHNAQDCENKPEAAMKVMTNLLGNPDIKTMFARTP